MATPEVTGRYLPALRLLVTDLSAARVVWALTGSLGHALQGVPVTPHDVDVQTDEAGAYAIARLFAAAIVRPVAYRESEPIRSHFGVLQLKGQTVEVMGALQKRLPDGSWEPPVDVARHRRFVEVDGLLVPVLSLAHEAEAYATLGRSERAALLRRFATAEAGDEA